MIGQAASSSEAAFTPVRSVRPKGRFVIGRDATGHWIVADERGLAGGVFADRIDAIRFAMDECGHNPGDVCAAPDGVVLSLDAVFDLQRPVAGNRRLG